MTTLKDKAQDDDYYIGLYNDIDKTNYKLYIEKDVKEAVLEFENVLNADLRYVNKQTYLEHIEALKNAYKKIFGDFEK